MSEGSLRRISFNPLRIGPAIVREFRAGVSCGC